MSAKAKTIVKGYAKKLREDTTFRRRTGAEIVELAVVVAKHKHPEEIFEGADAYKSKEHGYWTLEQCQEDAKRFQTRKEWQMGSAGYQAALRNGWLDLCCAHMTSDRMPAGHWTFERCVEHAKPFQTREAWRKESGSAYFAAHKNGWLDECCAHMTSLQTPAGYWTLERCQEDAMRFQTRNAWYKGGNKGYVASRRNGWLDLCCAHMTPGKTPNGYWRLERCQEDAKQFQTRVAWRKGSPAGFSAARKKGWHDLCCAHMTLDRMPDGHWTLARCQEDAKQFQTRVAWRKGGSRGYVAAYKNGWLDLCCAHMTSDRMPEGYWTLARCQEDAKRFQTRVAWQKGGLKGRHNGYAAACSKGWLDQCCGHMPKNRNKPPGYWTFERCVEHAKPFQTREAWRKESGSAYIAAYKNGWLDQCCAHMPAPISKKGKA